MQVEIENPCDQPPDAAKCWGKRPIIGYDEGMSAVDVDVNIPTGEMLPVGRLAEASGVSTRSIRYYEEQGLIESQRTESGHRRFDPETVERVVLIQRLFSAGLSSREIEPVLPCMVDESARTSLLVDVLRDYRERLAQEIRKQRETVRILDEVIDEYDTV
ncbi:MerR family transcriptional regulator [Microbacterium aurum]